MSTQFVLFLIHVKYFPAMKIFYDNASSFNQWDRSSISSVLISNHIGCAIDDCFLIYGGYSIKSISIPIQHSKNVSMQYSIEGSYLHSNDSCQVFYSLNNAIDWILLKQYTHKINNNLQLNEQYPLGLSADNAQSVQIKFSAIGNNITCYVDEIY
eukprot:97157_1